MKKKLALGLGVAGFCLWLALKGIQWSEVGESLQNVHWIPIIFIPVMMILTYFFRARRHQVLLRPIRHVGVGELFAINSVGFFMIHALPLRLGEMTRPLLLRRRHQIPFSTGLATVAVERVFDGLVATMALFLGIFSAPLHIEQQSPIGMSVKAVAFVSFGGFLLIFAFLLLAVLQRRRALQLVEVMLGIFSTKMKNRFIGGIDRFFEGLQSLPNMRSLLLILIESCGVWGVMIVAYWLGLQAFGLSLPWGASFTLLGLTAVGVMLPAAPGFVGTFQVFVIAALALYGVPKEIGLAYSIIIQGLNLLFVALMGVCFFPAVGEKAGHLISETVAEKA